MVLDNTGVSRKRILCEQVNRVLQWPKEICPGLLSRMIVKWYREIT